jgi:hypothetical protein
MPPAPEVPLGYISGVLDANAVFRVVEVEGTELPRIMLHGLHPDVLEVLASSTGTKVITTTRDYHRHACTAHCPPEHHQNKVKSTSSRWSLTGAKATVVISAVLPHLRAQTETAKAVMEVGLEAPRKPNTLDKMVELGWPIPEEWQEEPPEEPETLTLGDGLIVKA